MMTRTDKESARPRQIHKQETNVHERIVSNTDGFPEGDLEMCVRLNARKKAMIRGNGKSLWLFIMCTSNLIRRKSFEA